MCPGLPDWLILHWVPRKERWPALYWPQCPSFLRKIVLHYFLTSPHISWFIPESVRTVIGPFTGVRQMGRQNKHTLQECFFNWLNIDPNWYKTMGVPTSCQPRQGTCRKQTPCVNNTKNKVKKLLCHRFKVWLWSKLLCLFILHLYSSCCNLFSGW